MTEFVHLHVHSEYSLLDGAIKMNRLISQAAELNMKTIALTDHGNMFGVIDFYDNCIQKGLKPVIGQEFYMVEDRTKKEKRENYYHLVLLAKDQTGFKNLMRLSSSGYTEGHWYKPRIDKKVLREFSAGLIGLSACRGGEIQKMILQGSYKDAENAAVEFREILGEGNFYLELQRIGLKDDNSIITHQLEISELTGIPVVATNDVHYLTRDESRVHDVLLAIQTGKTISDENRWTFPTNEFYLKSPEEMTELFSDIPLAIENSVKIAEQCNVMIDTGGKNIMMPKVDIEEGYDNENDYLEHIAREGLNVRFKNEISDEAKERFDFEMSVIRKMNYSGYFIIIHNLVDMARKHNISVGPGRGSAVGSLILYCLSITQVNPLEYGLFFERFLNPERISMPDVDIDIADKDRDKLLKLLIEKYNSNNVAQIAAFGKLKSRQVFTDVARVFEVKPSEVKRITKKMAQNTSLEEAINESAELQDIFKSDPTFKDILKVALALENNTRHVSKHAAGIVITPTPLTDYVPIWKLSDDEVGNVTQFEKNALEKIGLVKIDVLGLRTLSVIDETLEYIENEKNEKIDLMGLSFDDEITFELIKNGRTSGVFQLESAGMKDFLRRYRPDVFIDIINIISFYRPGPMAGAQMNGLVRKKNKKEDPEFLNDKLKDVLSETYGYIIYQEQVMQIANKIAGFSFAKADILRSAMSKKKTDLMNKYKEEFVAGAVKNGMQESESNDLFDKIAEFAKYGFNKSHGTAYAVLSYQTAYLKAHYPLQFMAATINSYIGTIKEVVKYIREAKHMNIPILPPDINKSDFKVKVEGDSLRLGLGIIKNVGYSAVKNIIENRNILEFKDFYDFLTRTDNTTVNKKAVESLIKAGVFDPLGIQRNMLFENLEHIMNSVQNEKKEKESGMMNLFETDTVKEWKTLLTVDMEWDKEMILNNELEVLEFYISGHPLEKYIEIYDSLISHQLEDFLELEHDAQVIIPGIITGISKRKSKRGEMYANFKLFTMEGYIDVTAFSRTLEENASSVANDKSVAIIGKVSKQDENSMAKIIAEKIYLLSTMKDYIEGINIEIKIDELAEDKIDEFNEFLMNNQGNKAVRISIIDGKDKLNLQSKKYRVPINKRIFSKLVEIFGEGNVKYVFKNL